MNAIVGAMAGLMGCQDGGCEVCDYPITHMHHIVPRAYGGTDETSNLIALCPNHHAAIHILISQYAWQVRSAAAAIHLGRSPRPLPAKHGALLSQVLTDKGLVNLFNREFLPRWLEAGLPWGETALRWRRTRSAQQIASRESTA